MNKSYSPKIIISLLVLLFISSALQMGDFLYARYFPVLMTVSIVAIIALFRGIQFSIRFKNILIINSFALFLFIILSLIGNSTFDELLFDVTKLSLAFISSICFYYFVERSSMSKLNKAIMLMTIIVQLIMLIVLFVAYSNFSISLFTNNFHQFKVGTIFFYDTNALSIYGLAHFSFLLYYYRFYKKTTTIKILLFIFIVLIILCLSRASIIALIFILFFDIFKKSSRKLKIFYLLFSTTVIIYYSPFVFNLISEDGSGLTKLNIFNSLIEKLPNENLRSIFFGNGINEGNYTYSFQTGKYSHSLIPMIMGQFGMIGALLYFTYFSLHYFLYTKNTIYLLLPLFITGISYLHPFLETIFILHSVILALEFKRLGK